MSTMLVALLAVVGFADPNVRPYIVARYSSMEACQADALRLNRTTEKLREPEMRRIGAEFVCLKIERSTV